MAFRTDYVFCSKFVRDKGEMVYVEERVHSLSCYLRCKRGGVCDHVEVHEEEQARFLEGERLEKVKPASQLFLPGWRIQSWPEKEVKEKSGKDNSTGVGEAGSGEQ